MNDIDPPELADIYTPPESPKKVSTTDISIQLSLLSRTKSGTGRRVSKDLLQVSVRSAGVGQDPRNKHLEVISRR